MMEITKEEFERYEECRASGVTNMFDVNTVKAFTGLADNKILSIMKQYTALKNKFGE